MLVDNLEKAEELLLQLAEESFSDTEYAGKTHVLCTHCRCEQSFLSPDQDLLTSTHESYCLTRRARQVLGQTFVAAHQSKQDAEQAEQAKDAAKRLKQQRDEERRKQRKLENDREQRSASAKAKAEKKVNKHILAMTGNMSLLEKSLKKRG